VIFHELSPGAFLKIVASAFIPQGFMLFFWSTALNLFLYFIKLKYVAKKTGCG